MKKEEFERSVDAYLLEVRAKLMLGWEQWRDRAATFSHERILQEISEEAVDGLGWFFWAWLHIQRQRTTTAPLPPLCP